MKRLDPSKRSNLIPKGEKGKCRWCSKDVPKGRRSWCSEECVDDALIRAQPSYARRKVEERDKGVCADCGRDTEKIRHTLRRLGVIAREGLLGYDRTMNRGAKRYGLDVNRLHAVCYATATKSEMEARREQVMAQSARCGERHYFERNLELALDTTPAEQRIRTVNRRMKRLFAARLARLAGELIREGFDGIGRNGWLRRSLWDADHILPVVKGGGGCGLENYRTLCQPCHKRHTKALAAERAAARRGPTPPPDPELPFGL